MKKVKNKLINVTPMALIICTLNEDVAPGKKSHKINKRTPTFLPNSRVLKVAHSVIIRY